MNQLGDEYDSLDAQLKVTDAPGGKAAPAPAKIETQPALETREAIQQQIDNLRAQERASFRKSDNDQTLDGDAKRALADERVEARRKVKLLQEKLDQTKPKSAAAPGPSADVAKSEPQPTSKIGIPPQAAPAPATAEPGAKAETPAPPVETPPPAPTTQEPPPTTAVKPTEATAPRTAAEMSARARAVELATVHKGEGAWQAVRRQMYARLYDDTQKNPTKYGMSAEQAAKLPKDMEHPPKTGKIAKILNRETLATLKQAGYINEDGTTKIGMRPDARVILESDNRVTVANPEKTTYVFQEHKGGARHPADETRRASGRVGAPDATHDPKTHGSTDTSHTPDSELEHLNKRSDLDQHPLAEIGPRPEGATPTPEELRATAETAAIKTESANLRTAHLTPTEYRPITRMKGETFIKELARHAAEIREHQVHGPRKNFSIFINNGSFTGRGFTAGLKEAGKYLDLSERLEKHLDKMSWTPRQRLLKQPIGELLRIVNLKK